MNGSQLQPNKWFPLNEGDTVGIGSISHQEPCIFSECPQTVYNVLKIIDTIPVNVANNELPSGEQLHVAQSNSNGCDENIDESKVISKVEKCNYINQTVVCDQNKDNVEMNTLDSRTCNSVSKEFASTLKSNDTHSKFSNKSGQLKGSDEVTSSNYCGNNKLSLNGENVKNDVTENCILKTHNDVQDNALTKKIKQEVNEHAEFEETSSRNYSVEDDVIIVSDSEDISMISSQIFENVVDNTNKISDSTYMSIKKEIEDMDYVANGGTPILIDTDDEGDNFHSTEYLLEILDESNTSCVQTNYRQEVVSNSVNVSDNLKNDNSKERNNLKRNSELDEIVPSKKTKSEIGEVDMKSMKNDKNSEKNTLKEKKRMQDYDGEILKERIFENKKVEDYKSAKETSENDNESRAKTSRRSYYERDNNMLGKYKTVPPDTNVNQSNARHPYMAMESIDFILNILTWKPSWLQEQCEITKPPPINDNEHLLKMCKSYLKHTHYESVLVPLLKLEFWANLFDHWDKVTRNGKRYVTTRQINVIII